MNLLPRPIRGIIPPMVTPLLNRDALDVEGLERLIEHLLAGGVTGLFILGSTGEAPSLSYRLRRELIDATCRIVNRRVPVLVGITDTAFIESVELARHSARAGAAAVVTSAPYYFPAGQPELLDFIHNLARELPLPLFLYNMPSLTKVTFEVETVRRAMDMENIIGMKDSSGDLPYFLRLLGLSKQRSDWTLLIGSESLMAEVVLQGAHGGVTGGANIAPDWYVHLYHAAAAQDLPRVSTLQQKILQLGEGIYTVGQHSSSIIKGIKCSLELMGICHGAMAEPFHSFKEPQRRIIAERLSKLGIFPKKAAPSLSSKA